MKLYVPSWNGDFRLESDGRDKTKLVLHDPTPLERKIVGALLHQAGKKGWADKLPEVPYEGKDNEVPSLSIGIEQASKLLIKLTRPKRQTLTAVQFSDGKLTTIEGADDKALAKIEETVAVAAATEISGKKEAKAASVRRPTPCCPACVVGSVAPASEVLLSFLSEEEHASWSRSRSIIISGGLSGHRYLLAHRRSPLAAAAGKMCFDIDDGRVLHFHDDSVPPEEEVLAAKLILEHREPWLRNEATVLGGEPDRLRLRFKNPFGGFMDGTESSRLTSTIGEIFRS
jgi:hypothetical protein